jgi:hypothetical protein
MSAAERLQSLEEGEIVTGAPMFKGLSDTPVEAHVMKKSDKGAVTLHIMFEGIKLGAAGGKVNDGKIMWAEAK